MSINLIIRTASFILLSSCVQSNIKENELAEEVRLGQVSLIIPEGLHLKSFQNISGNDFGIVRFEATNARSQEESSDGIQRVPLTHGTASIRIEKYSYGNKEKHLTSLANRWSYMANRRNADLIQIDGKEFLYKQSINKGLENTFVKIEDYLFLDTIHGASMIITMSGALTDTSKTFRNDNWIPMINSIVVEK